MKSLAGVASGGGEDLDDWLDLLHHLHVRLHEEEEDDDAVLVVVLAQHGEVSNAGDEVGQTAAMELGLGFRRKERGSRSNSVFRSFGSTREVFIPLWSEQGRGEHRWHGLGPAMAYGGGRDDLFAKWSLDFFLFLYSSRTEPLFELFGLFKKL